MIKPICFLCVLAVALGMASTSPVTPDPEVNPVTDEEVFIQVPMGPGLPDGDDTEEPRQREKIPVIDEDLETNDRRDMEMSRFGYHNTMREDIIKKYPYQVSFMGSNEKGTFLCGGSIISPQWVLTAALCTLGNPAEITVRAGSAYSDKGGNLYKVSRILRHSLYRRMPDRYDIALMQIAGTFETGDSVKPIRLANSMPQPETLATISGWVPNRPSFDHLLAFNVSIATRKVCHDMIFNAISLDLYKNSRSAPSLFCAGNSGSHPILRPCNGNPGTPLMSGGEQMGILFSRNGNTACPESLTLYTDVFYFRQWIRDVTGV